MNSRQLACNQDGPDLEGVQILHQNKFQGSIFINANWFQGREGSIFTIMHSSSSRVGAPQWCVPGCTHVI